MLDFFVIRETRMDIALTRLWFWIAILRLAMVSAGSTYGRQGDTGFDHSAMESTTIPCQPSPMSQHNTSEQACCCCHCALDVCCVACRQLIGSDSLGAGSRAGMKTIKAKLQTRKPGGGLLGAELAELAKAATAKDVPKPDEELNEMVGSLVANLNWAEDAA